MAFNFQKSVGYAEATLLVTNVCPIVGEITTPIEPVLTETEVSASAVFSDPGKLMSGLPHGIGG